MTQLCQITSEQHNEAAAANPVLHVDFQFEDDQGTRLGETVDSAGMAKWDGGLSDCVTHDGSFRIRRNDTQPVNRYVDIRPDVRVRANEAGDPKSHRGWIVAEIAGWNLRGKTPNEIVRIGFTSQADRDLHVAGLQLRRSGDQEVTVEGMAFGAGSTPIKTTQRWPAKQPTPVTFVIELDKVAGNSGEGDSGGSYRLFSKSANQPSFQPLAAAAVRPTLRNGNYLHLHVEGLLCRRR